ncbi:MAG: hypothetical protein ABL903_18000 [Methylococcales bacterium]
MPKKYQTRLCLMLAILAIAYVGAFHKSDTQNLLVSSTHEKYESTRK